MCSAESLCEFISERLTAAAEDIFVVFKRIVIENEEEIARQRRLLDIIWKPHIYLHRIDGLKPNVCKEEEVAEQQLCYQEGNFNLDQEEPEPPPVKEEQDSPCSQEEGEQLEQKQETNTLIFPPTLEESGQSKSQRQNEQQLLSHITHVAEIQDLNGSEHRDSGSMRKSDLTPKNKLQESTLKTKQSEMYSESHPLKELETHERVHTGKKTHTCQSCGKIFSYLSGLKQHMRTHTGEKPYSCRTCGKGFSFSQALKVHMRIHTGERPHCCSTCGKRFTNLSRLKDHVRIHTDEKPFTCRTCGKSFRLSSGLKSHMRVHTGERPHSCSTCGKRFSLKSHLNNHVRIHTDEKPFTCRTCGRAFRHNITLQKHVRGTHTGERPHSCSTCGKRFFLRSGNLFEKFQSGHSTETALLKVTTPPLPLPLPVVYHKVRF
ncbi:zinc finger protein 664-like [Cheilinus undulatus]|uniref:zinc finger protein 664-like n=1 Tax=Cheilinus undulatus TaxID=241271 RepID=UPI001BD391F0|nr:zinc finger protein 664-like [Cheilinus undulatus]